jgi:hypothetical protein
MIGVGLLSGLIAGFLAFGVGSRLAMRISAVAGGEAIAGLMTENGNIVGQITADGTVFLLIAGAFIGLVGGLLYVAVRSWLPGSQRWKGLVFGVLLLLVFGRLLIDPDNADFSRFGPPLLNIALFASLFILFGLAVAPLAQRFDRWLPAASGGWAPVRAVYGLLPILPLAVLGAVGSLALRGGVIILFAVLLVLAACWLKDRYLARSSRMLFGRPIATTIGYAILAVLALVGLAMDIKAVSEIL